jgi:uncharacterized protein (DUF58 family)
MPTRMGWGLLLLTGGIAFAAVNTGNNLLYLLVGISLAVMVLSFVAGGRALRRLRLRLSFPDEILAASPTACVLELTNRHGRRLSPAVAVQARAGPESLPELTVPPLSPGSTRTRFAPARFRHRGLYRAGEVQLTTTDPFGLVRRRRHHPQSGEFYVLPAPAPLSRLEEIPTHPRGEAPARRIGDGLELHQMRDYQFHDDSRHIDWRATARAGQMMVKEFLEEGTEHLVLIFDPTVQEDSRRIRERFEGQVSLATALVLRCAENRVPFRFLAPGRDFPEVDPPGGHRAILEYLATVEPRVAPAEGPFARDLDGQAGTIRLGVPRAGAG